MSATDVILGVISIAVFAYLGYALFRAERF